MKNHYSNKMSAHPGAIIGKGIFILIFLLLSFTMKAGDITGTFTTLANCPMNLTCFTVDPTTGYFYGQGDQGSTNYYRYNPSTNTWTTMASCPVSSGNNGGATYLNGKIYNSYCSFSTLAVYDIATNTWTTMAGGLNAGSISNDGTNIYVSGDNIFKKYIVSTNTWETLAGTSCQPWGGLQYKNGFFYLHTGNGTTGFKKYQVSTNTWTTLTNVPRGAVLGSAIYDAYYYCQGSYGGTNLYSYDLGAGVWNNTLTLPFTTNDAAIVTYGNSLYIVQGEAGTGFTKFTPNNPMLTNIESSALAYNIGDAAKVISATITASQNSGTNFQSATVSITANFQSGKDVLSFTDANGITGSWNNSTGVLTLSGATSIANYQTALRSVKYSNSDATSTNLTRTISFKVYDGSQYSNTANRNIYFPGPPILTTNAISGIGTTTATSGGFVSEDGGSTVSARGVCWSTSPNPTISDSKTTDGSGLGSFTSSLSGLTSGATYYIRAYATNSFSTGYGNERTFTTIGPAITVSVTTLSGFTSCEGGAASSNLTFVVSGVYLLSNISVSAPAGFEISTSSVSGFGSSISLTPSGGTVSNTTIYVRMLSASSGSKTGNISASSTSAVTKTVSLSGTVSSIPVGGTLSGSSAITYGSASGSIQLTGYTGTIDQWQKKLNTGSYSYIGNTTDTYSETPSSAGFWTYRAMVGNGVCPAVFSSEFTITVNKATLTITGASVTSKVYDGNASAAITGASMSGIVGVDAVTLENYTSGTFINANAGTGKTVTTSMTISGAASGNYSLTQPTLSGNITAKPIAVTADAKTKVYGATDPALTYTFTPALVSGDSFTGALSRTAGENVGPYAISQNDLALSSNYTLNYTSDNLSITAKPIAVTADAKSKVYGEADPALTYTVTPALVSGDSFTGSLSRTAGEDVGSFTINQNDLALSSNYTLSYTSADLSITAKPIAVTADVKTKVYGEADPALTYTFSPELIEDDAFTGTLSRTAGENVGTFTINKNSLALSSNYTLSYTSANLSITAKPIVVTAEAKSKIYGEADPALTYTFTPALVSGDSFTGVLSRTAGENVGSYAISQNDLALSSNYTMTFNSADLAVNKATLSVTADNKEKVYGSVNPALTFAYNGFISSEDESVIDTKPLAATSITVNSDAGLHSGAITVSGGSDNNYQFSYQSSDFAITKAVLTVTADNKTKVYGEANPVLTFTYSGFVNGDDRNDIDVPPSIVTDAATDSPAGAYPVILALGNDNNYVINHTDGSLTITKAALTASADNKSKTYSEVNPELTVSYTGFVNDEGVSSLDVAPVPSTEATVSSGTGSYPVTLSTGSDNNYEITNIDGTLTVDKAVLKVTADDKSKIYGQPNPELTLSYSGFVNGDDLNVIDSKPSAFTSAILTSDAGSYNITADGGSDNNYSFEYLNGSLEIVKADQTITFQPVTAGLRATQSEELEATSTSGLPVTFEASRSDIAEINGNMMSVLREGFVTVTAYQDGNHNYNPAAIVAQTIETLPTFDNIRSLFTPNNDGMNDYWYIPDAEQYGIFHVQVYNRFGKLVYESSAYKNDWDGTSNGKPLPEASYYYIIRSESLGIIKGVVNIVR